MNFSGLVYQMRFINTEQVAVNVDIWDMAQSFGENPYGVAIAIVDNGDGTQTVTFTFNPLGGIVTGLSLDYSDDNGATWTTSAAGTTSPQSITIPTGDYIYRFVVSRQSSLTAVSTFGLNEVVYTGLTNFFYPGQVVTITGTSNNNGTFTVVSTSEVGSSQVVQFTGGDFLHEKNVEATFTDGTTGESFLIGSDVERIPLEGAGEPLHIQTTDNDEDKFTTVLGKSAVITFLSGDGVDFNTFAEGEDDRFFVHIYVEDDQAREVFRGFLVLEDNAELFLPDSNEVILTATDNLGMLADVPLTDFDGVVPTNENAIMSYIAWALAKTGLRLPIFVAMNIREAAQVALSADTTGEGHFHKSMFLDAKTFEDDIGMLESAFDVLDKIFRYNTRCFQRSASWWIVRPDEFEQRDDLYLFEFDHTGAFVANHGLVPLSKSIYKGDADGSNEGDIFFSEEQTNVQAEQARKMVKLTYNLEFPLEIPCNVNYDRGAENTDPDVELEGYTAYFLECWEERKLWGADLTTADFKASIQKKYTEFGDEEERFIMLTQPASATVGNNNYIRSQPIPINATDKFRFTFDAAAVDDTGGDGTMTVCMMILYGVDGEVYILQPEDVGVSWDNTLGEIQTSWKVTNEEIDLFRSGLQWAIFDDADHPNKTEWTSFIIKGAPVPVSGNLYIHLFAANQFVDAFDTFRIKYQALNFEYHPYIGGTYNRYDARYSKVTQSLRYKQVLDEEVYISDSPKNIFKGALLKEGPSGTEFPHDLATQFYNAAVFPDAVPDALYIHPFYHIQNFDVWNQYNRSFRIFQGNCQGIMTADEDDLGLNNAADLVHKWYFNDPDESTVNRYFLLLTFDQNWYTCEWTGTFKEVFKTDVPKDYASLHEVKYITNDSSRRG